MDWRGRSKPEGLWIIDRTLESKALWWWINWANQALWISPRSKCLNLQSKLKICHSLSTFYLFSSVIMSAAAYSSAFNKINQHFNKGTQPLNLLSEQEIVVQFERLCAGLAGSTDEQKLLSIVNRLQLVASKTGKTADFSSAAFFFSLDFQFQCFSGFWFFVCIYLQQYAIHFFTLKWHKWIQSTLSPPFSTNSPLIALKI